MATLAELLASSLAALKQVQQSGDFTIVKSGELSPTHLKRLLANHFLMPVIKGWYIVTDPRAVPGDSTAWYASFWNFILRYATERYGKEWCLSAEQSLAIYSGSTTVPKQVLIRSPRVTTTRWSCCPRPRFSIWKPLCRRGSTPTIPIGSTSIRSPRRSSRRHLQFTKATPRPCARPWRSCATVPRF